MFFNKGYERGQVLLVVILAAVVALTVGLAAVSRSITNTKVTTEEENSQKALSAAEAGVEELAGNASLLATGSNKQLSNNSKFDAKATALAVTNPFAINGGQLVSKDDGADIWLSNYPDYSGQWSGTLTIYWQKNADCTKEAALEIVVLSGASTNSPNLARYTVDGCASRRSGNSFSAPTSSTANRTISGVIYDNSYTLPAAITSGFIARVVPLYNDTKMGVGYITCSVISVTCPVINPFPSQGSMITSTGAFGNTKRTVQVVKGYPRVPIEFFPYSLFLP